ncbi:MAG: HAD-IC family P-type ATPase [Patescibacteria group bacterium]|jgi:Ca2+-transporting ATPase
MPKHEVNFYNLSFNEVISRFKTGDNGLTLEEAKNRLKEHGFNKLPEEKGASSIKLFFAQFKSVLIYILLIAAVINFFLVCEESKSLNLSISDQADTYIILITVLINIIVGFIQENKAQKSLQALKKIISLSARIIRGGKEFVINAQELVPGDVMLISAGDKIPADVRLTEVEDLEANESALTGESEPVKKTTVKLEGELPLGDRLNMVFTGTTITKGQGRGIVITTGEKTEIGRIAKLIKETKDESTPLQQKLNKFSKSMGIVVLAVAAVLMIIGFLQGDPFIEIFTVSVAVAVSALPEGLAIGVTVILALGMQRILKQKALVRKLVAAETLGSTTFICTDKTGTLTEGKMQVTDLITWDHDFNVKKTEDKKLRSKENEEMLFALHIGLMCNDARIDNIDDDIDDWIISGNLTERALLLAATQAGLQYKKEHSLYHRLDSIPFDSEIKYMATLHKMDAKRNIVYFKGAPEKVFNKCTHLRVGNKEVKFDEEKREKFLNKFTTLSNKGLRVIALAYRHIPVKNKRLADVNLNTLVFVGYVGIKDPLRPTSKETVEECHQAGIKVVMITGDHKLTASAIAKDLGLPCAAENILEGQELDKMSDDILKQRVEEVFVYARVSPEHKLRIVQALRKRGEVVAMTGDGINDSPALKASDIGVALGSGTQVAKETADMVILDDNFRSIVGAVEEGRGIFDNIKKTVLYLISDCFSEVVLLTGSILMGMPLPLVAGQILWINLVNDTLPNLALTKEPKEQEIMFEPPRGRKAEILTKDIKILVVFVSLFSGLCGLGLFYFFNQYYDNVVLARSVTFAMLGLDSLICVFSMRSLRKSIFQGNLFSNLYLIGAVIISFAFLAAAFYVPLLQQILKTEPLQWSHWLLVLALCLVEMGLIEALKFIFMRGRIKLISK